MGPNERFLTFCTLPGLGIRKLTDPLHRGEIQRSQYLSDEMLNTNMRYRAATSNIRSRRGRKVELNVPIFRDERTPWPFHDPTVNFNLQEWPEDDDVRKNASKENHIYMDSFLFGGGNCALQVTVQAKDIEEARQLYDQFIPLGPIMLALTAATPMCKGYLADTDVRWYQLTACVDDRTLEELGEKVGHKIIKYYGYPH